MVAQQLAVHMGLRYRLYLELEPEAHRKNAGGLSLTNSLIVGLVVFSFVLLAVETEPALPAGVRVWVRIANLAVLAAFAVEFLLRLWSIGEDPQYRGVGGRLRYLANFYTVADLVAFLPELLWLALMPDSAGEEGIVVLRFLRLLRMLKIVRFVPAFQIIGAAFRRAGGQLLTTLILALALVYLSAVLLYFIEGVHEGREEFASIPRAIWWAVATLTTVGYGDVYPVTPAGRVAAGIIAIAGIGVVALPAGIFASAFSDELREREKAREALQMEIKAATAETAALNAASQSAD